MLPPVRCFTCGRVLADQYDYYVREVQKLQNKIDEAADKPKASKKSAASVPPPHFDGVMSGPVLDKLGLKRYCCRRMMLGIQDMMDTI
jgi:DNA-directed RNA polymerase subunit N (RpoN/RPB10)